MNAFSDTLLFINGLELITNLREIELERSIIGFVRGAATPFLVLARVSYC